LDTRVIPVEPDRVHLGIRGGDAGRRLSGVDAIRRKAGHGEEKAQQDEAVHGAPGV
jgi:hypothetical protein